MPHFELILGYAIKVRVKVHSFPNWLSSCCSTIYWEDYHFPIELSWIFLENQLIVGMWVISGLCSIDLYFIIIQVIYLLI